MVDFYCDDHEAENDFTDSQNVRHQLWKIEKENVIAKLVELFHQKVTASYIADGHHRSAAAKPKESPKNIYSLSHSKDIAKHNILSNALKSSCKSFTTELSKITLLQR